MDNLEVSTDGSDSEDDSNFQSAKIFTQLPVDTNNEKIDIDSGDENQPTGDASILSGNLLLGSDVLQVNTPSGRIIKEDEEKLSNKNEINRPSAKN